MVFGCVCLYTYQNHAGGAGVPPGSVRPSTAAPHTPGAHPNVAIQWPPCCHDCGSEASAYFSSKSICQSSERRTGNRHMIETADKTSPVASRSLCVCVGGGPSCGEQRQLVS